MNASKNSTNNIKSTKPKTTKHDAYKKPEFDAYETAGQKQQQFTVNADIRQQAQLFTQLLNSEAVSDANLDAIASAPNKKAKTVLDASLQTQQQEENQRQIASITSHLASQFKQQEFSVDMPNLGRLNIKVDLQESNKQLDFYIETSDNQSKGWLNQHQQSISQGVSAQTGWHTSIKVIS